MNKKIYKKFLEDKINNIQDTFKNIYKKLDIGEISYPELLYLESNLYQELILAQHELNNLEMYPFSVHFQGDGNVA